MPLLFRGVIDETVSVETVPIAETVLFRGVTDETVSVYGDSANNDPTVRCHTHTKKEPRYTQARKSSIRLLKAQLEANKVPLSRLRAITPHRLGFEPSLLTGTVIGDLLRPRP